MTEPVPPLVTPWGRRLPVPPPDYGPPMISSGDIAVFEKAFDTTDDWRHARPDDRHDLANAAWFARYEANLAPPEGYLFAHQLNPFSVITIVTLQPNEDRRLTVHRDRFAVPKPWTDKWILGDRIYFPAVLPGPNEANMARFNVVNPQGKSPRFPIALGIGRLGLSQGVRHDELLVITQLSAAKDPSFLDPQEITAAAFEQLGLRQHYPSTQPAL